MSILIMLCVVLLNAFQIVDWTELLQDALSLTLITPIDTTSHVGGSQTVRQNTN